MELHYWRGRRNVALSRHQRETLIFIIIIHLKSILPSILLVVVVVSGRFDLQ